MRHLFSLFLMVLVLFSCTDEYGPDKSDVQSAKVFNVLEDYVLLKGDSTNAAGVLHINAPCKEVTLKWNAMPEFNLDTTVTTLQVSNGECELPIKWRNRMDNGLYPPKEWMFDAGVTVIAGDLRKYVRLVWADEVDVEKMKTYAAIQTRATEEETPPTSGVLIEPLLLELDHDATDTAGVTKLTIYSSTAQVDATDFLAMPQSAHGLNLAKISGMLMRGERSLIWRWTDTSRPETFIGYVKVKPSNSGDMIKYAFVHYVSRAAGDWQFIKSIPPEGSDLPAKDAMVIVTVDTNQPWSIESRHSPESPVKSATNSSGVQSLVMNIAENTGLLPREIAVTVKSKVIGINDTTLVFNQLGTAGTFKYLNTEPSVSEGLPHTGGNVRINVETTRQWWYKVGIQEPTPVPADTQYANFNVSPNTTTSPIDIMITIGYDDVLVETVVLRQAASGELIYESNELPTPIPVDGGTYPFTFSGSYAGTVQVRALLNGVPIVTSAAEVTKRPTLAIPNNYASLASRNLTFEYRMGDGQWTSISDANRMQEGAKITSKVLPAGNVPAEGGMYSCVFGGTYKGNIILGAVIGTDTVKGNGVCPGAVEVDIPALEGIVDRPIDFLYSTDNGQTWTKFDTKTQSAGTLRFGSVTPDGIIPADGKTYSCSATGTYNGNVIFRARSGSEVLATQTSKVPKNFELTVPKNPQGTDRQVIFEYKKEGEDDTKWVLVDTRTQTRNVNVKPDGTEVGGFEEGNGSNVNVDL